MFKLKLLSIFGTALLTLGMFSASAVQTYANAQLQGGDFFQAFNNTTQEGTWRDPVTGEAGQAIEFRVTAKNSGDQVAEHVQIWGSTTGQVPQDPSNQHVFSAKIANANFGGQELTDTVTINVSGAPQGMRYIVGHARINGVTNLYNCPNSCDIPDNGVLGGLEVGSIQPGDFVELTYKAYITNVQPASSPSPSPSVSPSPSPSVSPSPSPSHTPAPTPSPSGSTNQTVKCPDGHDVTVIAGQNANVNTLCQQQQQTQTQTSTNTNTNTSNSNNTNNNSATGGSSSSSSTSNPSINITVPASTTQVLGTQTVAVSGVKELPKTGLPLVAWLGGAFIPAGLKLRKNNKGLQTLETANYIWEDRQFKI